MTKPKKKSLKSVEDLSPPVGEEAVEHEEEADEEEEKVAAPAPVNPMCRCGHKHRIEEDGKTIDNACPYEHSVGVFCKCSGFRPQV